MGGLRPRPPGRAAAVRGRGRRRGDLVERLLVDLEEELEGFHLEYQAEAAATEIGWLHVAGRRLDRYEAAAERIGSRNWQPVVAMAESALDAGRQDLAVAVYRAADQPASTRVTSVSAACSSPASTSPPAESYGSCAEHGAERQFPDGLRLVRSRVISVVTGRSPGADTGWLGLRSVAALGGPARPEQIPRGVLISYPSVR